jgi:hypothetical protein
MSNFEWLEQCLKECINKQKCVICYESDCMYVCKCGVMVCSFTCKNIDKIGPTTIYKMLCKQITNPTVK